MSAATESDKSADEFFEYWSNLFKTAPERFEAERKAAIEKIILEARPEHQKSLWDFQRSLDVKAKEGALRKVREAWKLLRSELKNLCVMQSRLE